MAVPWSAWQRRAAGSRQPAAGSRLNGTGSGLVADLLGKPGPGTPTPCTRLSAGETVDL